MVAMSDGLAKANFLLTLALFATLLIGVYYAYDFVQNSPVAKLLTGSSSAAATS